MIDIGLNSQAAPADATTATTEAAPATQTQSTETSVKDQYQQRLQALARKEKNAFFEKQRAAKEREEAIKIRTEAEEKYKTYQQFETTKQKAKINPLEYLKQAGLSYEDITNYVLNGGKAEPDAYIQEVRQELDQVRKEFADKEKQREAQALKAQEQQVNEVLTAFKSNVDQTIANNAEKYELVNKFDGNNIVYSLIEEYFDKTQKVLSIEEACEMAEDFLEKEVEMVTKTKKFQSKYQLTPAQAAAQDAKQSQKPQAQQGMSSLNNNLTQTSAGFLSPATEQDRMMRAMRALGGN